MKRIYILILVVISASALGCVENKTETPEVTSSETPSQIPVSPGESTGTQAPILSEGPQTPAPGEDIFGTYGDLAAMDNLSSDMDMQIALSNEI